jgi:hypothetical protein
LKKSSKLNFTKKVVNPGNLWGMGKNWYFLGTGFFAVFFERSGFRGFNGSQHCGDSSYLNAAGKG